MPQSLETLRKRIQQIDDETVRLLRERMRTVQQIGRLKNELGFPVVDPERENRVLTHVSLLPHDPIPTERLQELFQYIIRISREVQSIDLEKKT